MIEECEGMRDEFEDDALMAENVDKTQRHSVNVDTLNAIAGPHIFTRICRGGTSVRGNAKQKNGTIDCSGGIEYK